MLRSLLDLELYDVEATDGIVGNVEDFLVDDERWGIRHLVVKAGGFLGERKVLISPLSFGEIDWSLQRFHLSLTMDQIRRSPSVDTDRPVSRQHEKNLHRHYENPYYWGSSGIWGNDDFPGILATARWNEGTDNVDEKAEDIHLRSANEMQRYEVHATDGVVGHLVDFVADTTSWSVRYLVLDTSRWGFGKKVLIAPRWVKEIKWIERHMFVELSRKAIKESPVWDPSAPVNREYEARLYDYYGRPVYWASDDTSQAALDAGEVPSAESPPP